MPRGKSGPKPKTPEQIEEIKKAQAEKEAAALAAKAAKAKEREDAKAAKAQAAADEKAKKETEKAEKKAQRDAAKNGAGHNSDLNNDELRALLVNGVGKIVEHQASIAKINGDLRNERKRLKSYGFDTAEVNYAIKLRKSEDHDGDRNDWQKLIRVALFMNHPIGTQPDLFYQAGDGVDRAPSVDKAYEEGKMVGMEGKRNCTPPTEYGQEQADSWIKGWHDGQALLVRNGFKEPSVLIKANGGQTDFDDALDSAPSSSGTPGDDFMPAVPDHAGDPTSPANPNNRLN